MTHEKLTEFAQEIEMLGFDRGVKTILDEILNCQEEGQMGISYNSIRKIREKYETMQKDLKVS